jgi:hypothetical protein
MRALAEFVQLPARLNMTISPPRTDNTVPGHHITDGAGNAKSARPPQHMSLAQRAIDLFPARFRRRMYKKRAAQAMFEPVNERTKAALFSMWDNWAGTGGTGENRAEAIARLKAWTERSQPDRLLDLSGLGLTSLPGHLPDDVRELAVGGNKLSGLPPLPVSLRHLDAHNNQLTSLPALPDSIEVIEVHDNQLTHLSPRLPFGLRELYVESNRLESLPDPLPATLGSLFAHSNQLSHLPTLPDTIEVIEVHGNRLTCLPSTLPPNLRELYVESNCLERLPEPLPDTLNILDVRHNELSALPAKPPRNLFEITWCGNPIKVLPDIWRAKTQ